ncbi:MAG: methyltransferase domain-containing protein [Chloroflexi bacterium]|nr:methyltransferase domain-containing protein [Chloroflexota bacterium]
MDCCSVNGLEKMFGRSVARRDLKQYLGKGLTRRARLLAEFLEGQGVKGLTILEIGCGIGSLHLELLKLGAASAMAYEVSSAYLEAARELSVRLGLGDRVEYRHGDFVEHAAETPEADVVLLDRVVCCYPDMGALVALSAQRARRLYVLTYPRETWWMRAAHWGLNAVTAVLRRRYRFYLHPSGEMEEAAALAGLAPLWRRRSGMWELVAFQRQPLLPPTQGEPPGSLTASGGRPSSTR